MGYTCVRVSCVRHKHSSTLLRSVKPQRTISEISAVRLQHSSTSAGRRGGRGALYAWPTVAESRDTSGVV